MSDQPIGDYRDLIAWQRAIELALMTDEICDRLPRRQWRLADQMRRASNSVHSSIAEGNGTFTTADYLRFLGMSNASLNELESDLHFLRRRYGERDDVAKAQSLAVDVRKPLWGLIKALRKKRDNEGS